MQIEVAPDANMAMDSRGLLRSLQNASTPRLDLFVREALQNSLDAMQEGQNAKLELHTGQLETEHIAAHFDGISSELISRYGGEAPYMMLRDSGTAGLSGPVRYQDIGDDRGNLRKLIYEIAKPQEAAGSGGSWGLGKTVYFRMGIGLVIYYSRFRNPKSGRYESRIAAAMVEDQSGVSPILTAAGQSQRGGRGIAWWGQTDPEYPQSGSTIPLTDEREILSVLRDFEIEPYRGTETGTTVLIPFISTKELLQETKGPSDDGTVDAGKLPYWHDHLDDYLEIAVQRWYAPRLGNHADFDSRSLNITLNGREIIPEPFTVLMQALYHAGRNGSGKFRGQEIQVREIGLNSVFTGRGRQAGRLSFIRLPKSELGVGGPARKPDPYAYAGLTPAPGRNHPIVAFTRQPGMIVSYETERPWVPQIRLEPDEYMIGLFVPDSGRILREPVAMPFEEYLRSAELADHKSWQDRLSGGRQRTIIKRIQEKIRAELRAEFEKRETKAAETRTDLGLGRAIAQVVMPPGGFGGWDEGRGGADQGGGGSGGKAVPKPVVPPKGTRYRGKRVSIRRTGEPIWTKDGITVPFRIELGSHDGAKIQIHIRTEGAPMGVSAWEIQTGRSSPVRMRSFQVSRVYAAGELVAEASPATLERQVSVTELSTPSGTPYGVTIEDRMCDRRLSIEGLLTYTADSAEGFLEAGEIDT